MSIRKTKLGRSLVNNAHIIFKIIGFAGLLAAPVLTVPSTVKAVRACDKRKQELGIEKLPAGEIVKTSWKYYVPIVSLMGASTMSVVNGESISSKRTAIISAAYNAAEQTLVDYKEETVKQIGEAAEKDIEYRVLERQSERARSNNNGIPIQGEETGGTLFYEPMTGTFFYSTRNKVDKAFNELSAQMIREDYVTLGDLFGYLDLKYVETCGLIGWNTGRVKSVEPDYKWAGIEETATPYTIMSYKYYPTPDYIPKF